MMRFAIDTNRYVDAAKNLPDATAVIRTATKILLPFVVLAEMRSGFLGGSQRTSNEQALNRFLNQPLVEVLYADEQTTHHWARLALQLRRQGTPIPHNDTWIAALCVQHNL